MIQENHPTSNPGTGRSVPQGEGPAAAPALVKTASGYRYNPEREPDFSSVDWRRGHAFIPAEKHKKCRGCGRSAKDSVHEGHPPWTQEDTDRLRPKPTQDEIIAFLESRLPAPPDKAPAPASPAPAGERASAIALVDEYRLALSNYHLCKKKPNDNSLSRKVTETESRIIAALSSRAPASPGTVQAPSAGPLAQAAAWAVQVLIAFGSLVKEGDPAAAQITIRVSTARRAVEAGKRLAAALAGAPSAGRPMTWTREKPKQEGWYWFRYSPSHPKEPLWVETRYGLLQYFHPIHECHYELMDGEYCSIPAPETSEAKSGEPVSGDPAPTKTFKCDRHGLIASFTPCGFCEEEADNVGEAPIGEGSQPDPAPDPAGQAMDVGGAC